MSHVFLAPRNYIIEITYDVLFHLTYKLGYQQNFKKSIIQQIKRTNSIVKNYDLI